MRMLKFIGAETVLAVDISAITGSFADLSVTGRLSAAHIDSDVQNVKTLYNGTPKEVASHTTIITFPTLESLDNLDFIAGLGKNTGDGNTWASWSIPASELVNGTSSSLPSTANRFSFSIGSADAQNVSIYCWKSSNNMNLYMQPSFSNDDGVIGEIWGVKQPS